MKFRKKPVVVEAVQWTGKNMRETREFMGLKAPLITRPGGVVIPTLEGDMLAAVGDWIIRGVKGEFYPVKPDIMFRTYDLVPDYYSCEGKCACCGKPDCVLELQDEKAYCCFECFITKTREQRMAEYSKRMGG